MILFITSPASNMITVRQGDLVSPHYSHVERQRSFYVSGAISATHYCLKMGLYHPVGCLEGKIRHEGQRSQNVKGLKELRKIVSERESDLIVRVARLTQSMLRRKILSAQKKDECD